ncbi:hypothetical protein MUK42_13350 [Musa troglodytarum]|uniref:Uncharacterized protein n=1 Tax=Musa troglodytarum TaxID=320322 RepID=A0A9E7L808_9LILI|nr:hypothetical protein MUK42_13350 [Musa troglodytarum]
MTPLSLLSITKLVITKRRKRKRRRTCLWSPMHPLDHLIFMKRMSLPSAIFTPALASRAVAASALP